MRLAHFVRRVSRKAIDIAVLILFLFSKSVSTSSNMCLTPSPPFLLLFPHPYTLPKWYSGFLHQHVVCCSKETFSALFPSPFWCSFFSRLLSCCYLCRCTLGCLVDMTFPRRFFPRTIFVCLSIYRILYIWVFGDICVMFRVHRVRSASFWFLLSLKWAKVCVFWKKKK